MTGTGSHRSTPHSTDPVDGTTCDDRPVSDQPRVPKELLGRLSVAARDRVPVRFGYLADDGNRSQRVAEPYRQVLHRGTWYLLAWDVRRRDWRTFRLDRMSDARPARGTFSSQRLPGDAASVHLDKSTPRLRASLVFDAPLGTVADRLLTQEGEFEDVGDDRCRALLWVDSYEWLAAVTLSMGIDFRIEEPDGFRVHCTELRDRLDRAVRRKPV